MKLSHCRGCATESARHFFSIDRVPVGSCVLLDDPDAARAFPTHRIDLAICQNCGLIQNTSFDASLVDYTSGYEESQAYSATFRSYSRSLIEHLDGRYDLTGKLVVEPGCGKGEFLVDLCELTGATGIGVDPAHVAGRIDTTADVRFANLLFTKSSPYSADLLVCRHTLEHIADVLGFFEALAGAARAPDGAIVVEVPDSGRILDEGAFWDVYYEHATYFTETSLKATASRAGLVVDDISVWFADQYLVLEAHPDDRDVPAGDADQQHQEEVQDLIARCERFADVVTTQIASWKHHLASAVRPVLWGASSKAVGFLAAVGSDRVVGAVDINPYKQGSYLAGSGIRIWNPDDLRNIDPDLVIVMNPIYRDEIASTLDDLGLQPTLTVC